MNLVRDDVRSLTVISDEQLETPHVVSYGSASLFRARSTG
jgi:hypothetical protein